jgi:hypothetical protein
VNRVDPVTGTPCPRCAINARAGRDPRSGHVPGRSRPTGYRRYTGWWKTLCTSTRSAIMGPGMYLDDVIPDPDYRICHSRVVRAPATVVWDELTRVPMSALPVAYALEAVRLLPARLAGRRHPRLAGRTFLDVTPIPILFSERPHVVLSAGIGQAWRLLGGPTPPLLDAAALRAWTEPGWIKVGMGFRLESTRAGTVLTTETRVVATDPRTRRAFAAYWFVIRGSSSTIRREVLRVVAHRAETPPRRT